jgi:thiopeptide-type bacteriocin biosynthesis protein
VTDRLSPTAGADGPPGATPPHEGFPTLAIDVAVLLDPATRRPAVPWGELAEGVARWRADGLLRRFSFVRKPPGLRLRFDGPALGELEPELALWLGSIEARGLVRGARRSVYEPELARFGGRAGLALAHRWFDHDAAAALAYEVLGPDAHREAPRALVALVALDDLVRRAVGDDAERWEVWVALAEMVAPLPADLEPDEALVADCLDPGGSTRSRLVAATGGLLETAWAANEATAARLRAAASFGLLDIGVRAWLASGAPFHWNRFGLPLEPAELRATVVAAAGALRPAAHRRPPTRGGG